MLCESCMYKWQEKTCDEFGNDPMKMCFEHKTKMKVDHKIKDVVNVIFIKWIMILMEHFLLWGSYVWACEYFFLLHCGLHLVKLLHNNWYSPYFIMWNEIIERINGPIKKRWILFPQCCSYVFFILAFSFERCFDNFIKIYTLYHYYIAQTIWYQPIYISTSML
jgi:glycosyltransferase involved in cell wall biosynthesis